MAIGRDWAQSIVKQANAVSANNTNINDLPFNGVDFISLFILDLLKSNALQYSLFY